MSAASGPVGLSLWARIPLCWIAGRRSGPSRAHGPAWTCKTTFSPSSGKVGGRNRSTVKIKTAIGNCAGYTLAFNTSSGPLDMPVSCSSTAVGPGLVADPSNIGDPGDADGWCVLTSGVVFQKGGVFTCYVALFANSSAPVPWVAAGPTSCGWKCETTFSPSHGVAGANGIWVEAHDRHGGLGDYPLFLRTHRRPCMFGCIAADLNRFIDCEVGRLERVGEASGSSYEDRC